MNKYVLNGTIRLDSFWTVQENTPIKNTQIRKSNQC